MTPAPDTGRAAEETMREEIRKAIKDRWDLLTGPAQDAGNVITGAWRRKDLCEEFANVLLAGPIAHLRAENARLLERIRQAEKGAEAMRKRASDVVRYRGQRARLALQGSCDGAVVNRAIRDACANMASEIDALTPETQEAGDGR